MYITFLGSSRFCLLIYTVRGTRWRRWLRHCATSQKVADSIPWAALWSWGRLSLKKKWVPVYLLRGKGSRFVGLITLPFSYTDCLEMVASTSWSPKALSGLKMWQLCLILTLLVNSTVSKSTIADWCESRELRAVEGNSVHAEDKHSNLSVFSLLRLRHRTRYHCPRVLAVTVPWGQRLGNIPALHYICRMRSVQDVKK
jgi:hypothetical protein